MRAHEGHRGREQRQREITSRMCAPRVILPNSLKRREMLSYAQLLRASGPGYIFYLNIILPDSSLDCGHFPALYLLRATSFFGEWTSRVNLSRRRGNLTDRARSLLRAITETSNVVCFANLDAAEVTVKLHTGNITNESLVTKDHDSVARHFYLLEINLTAASTFKEEAKCPPLLKFQRANREPKRRPCFFFLNCSHLESYYGFDIFASGPASRLGDREISSE